MVVLGFAVVVVVIRCRFGYFVEVLLTLFGLDVNDLVVLGRNVRISLIEVIIIKCI